MDEAEWEKLQKHCQCAYCLEPWWKLSFFKKCPCCVGCLKESSMLEYRQTVVDKTRQYIELHNPKII